MNLFFMVNCGVMLLTVCQTVALVTYFRFGRPGVAVVDASGTPRVVCVASASTRHPCQESRETLAPVGPAPALPAAHEAPARRASVSCATLALADPAFLKAWSLRGPPLPA